MNKRKEFRKKFFSSGMYSFIEGTLEEIESFNKRHTKNRRKIFGTFSFQKCSPPGVLRY